MITTTIDKTAVITAERGSPAAEMRKIFGEEYKSTHVVLTAQFEGEWPTRADMREELQDLFEEILRTFDEKM